MTDVTIKLGENVYGVDALLQNKVEALVKILEPIKHLWKRYLSDPNQIVFETPMVDFQTFFKLVVVLDKESRQRFMDWFAKVLFPIYTMEEREKMNSLVAIHKMKNEKMMFVEYNEVSYVLKQFESHWDFLRNVTAKFSKDGVFCKIIASLSKEEEETLLSLVEEGVSVEAIVKEMEEKGPEAFMKERGVELPFGS